MKSDAYLCFVHRLEVSSLQERIDGLNWKLEEAVGLEEELEELRRHSGSSSDDRDKLLAEIARLSAVVQEVESAKAHGAAVQEAVKEKEQELEETKLILSVKEEEIQRLQDAVSQGQSETIRLKEEMNLQNMKIKELSALEEKVVTLTEELSEARKEAEQYRRHTETFTSKLDTVRSLEADFESLSEDYSSVLRDNSALAQQVEELHSRIGDLTKQVGVSGWAV